MKFNPTSTCALIQYIYHIEPYHYIQYIYFCKSIVCVLRFKCETFKKPILLIIKIVFDIVTE